MLLLLSIVLFAICLIVPAILTIRESVRPRDDGRLHIAEQYIRDPRWFGRSFRTMLAPFVAQARGDAEFQEDVKLRTDEDTRWAPDLAIPAKQRLRGIAVGERVTVGDGAGIRDAYALETLDVGAGVVARTLTSDGSLQIGAAVNILRWIDAEGEITVGADSNLGVSASSGGRITLAERVQFERVWGRPVASETTVGDPMIFSHHGNPHRVGQREVDKAGSKSMILYGAVRIAHNTTIPHHLKVHGSVEIEPGVKIGGNLIARGDVTIASDFDVEGHVFAEGDVWLGPHSRVGRSGSIKTVYASGHVLLAHDVEVEGWVVAENGGQTL